MTGIKVFHVSHSEYVYSFDIEINFDTEYVFSEDAKKWQKENGHYIDDTVKSYIKEMSCFWMGHPSVDSDFKEHLNFFLEVLGRKVAGYMQEESSVEFYVNKEIGESEGYYPIFGEGKAIHIKNIEFDHDFLYDFMSIKEGV